MNTPRILVLGSSGFIGRALCRAALDEGCGPNLVLHVRRRDQLDPAHEDVEWRELDLVRADLSAYADLIDGVRPDVVVNCVGLTSGTGDELHAVNVDVVTKLIATLVGRPHVHLIHIGSAAEYGVQPRGVPVAETALAAPRSVYALSKYESTRRLMDSVAAGRINVTILRVFNPLGRHSPAATLAGSAAALFDQAIRNDWSEVHLGNLDTWRDYVDTRDVASATLAAAVARHEGGVVLNVGRGQPVQSRHLITSLAAIAGFEGRIGESRAGSERSTVVQWQCADITAIREQLRWRPRYSTADSLHDLWDAARNISPPLHR